MRRVLLVVCRELSLQNELDTALREIADVRAAQEVAERDSAHFKEAYERLQGMADAAEKKRRMEIQRVERAAHAEHETLREQASKALQEADAARKRGEDAVSEESERRRRAEAVSEGLRREMEGLHARLAEQRSELETRLAAEWRERMRVDRQSAEERIESLERAKHAAEVREVVSFGFVSFLSSLLVPISFQLH